MCDVLAHFHEIVIRFEDLLFLTRTSKKTKKSENSKKIGRAKNRYEKTSICNCINLFLKIADQGWPSVTQKTKMLNVITVSLTMSKSRVGNLYHSNLGPLMTNKSYRFFAETIHSPLTGAFFRGERGVDDPEIPFIIGLGDLAESECIMVPSNCCAVHPTCSRFIPKNHSGAPQHTPRIRFRS